MDKKASFNILSFFFAVTILTVTVIFVLSSMNSTKKETEVTVNKDIIELKGQYGTTYKVSEITEVRLEDNTPAIGLKKNGAGLGEIKKGDYEVEGLGLCRLFIHSEKGPYIFILANSKVTIMNFYDAEKTREVYALLKAEVDK